MASELEREGLDIPLLIGGATTSKLHTALKIDPLYNGPVVYLKDASKAVPVANKLLNPETKQAFVRGLKSDYDLLRSNQAKPVEIVSLDYARKHPYQIDWNGYKPVKPLFEGSKVIEHIPIKEIIPYVEWTFFMAAWKFPVKFAGCTKIESTEAAYEAWLNTFSAEDKEKATEALKLVRDARKMLLSWSEKDYDFIKAIISFYPVTIAGEGICVNGKDIP